MNMDHHEQLLLDVTIDLVAFYDVLQGDLRGQIDKLAQDLEKCCRGNPNVEIIHTGSGFEGLSLPHLESSGLFSTWNTDADHMLIRTDIKVLQGLKSRLRTVDEEPRGELVSPRRVDGSMANGLDGGSTVYIYDASHAGYVNVSSKDVHPSDAQPVEDHCFRNTEFIEKCKDLIPLKDLATINTMASGELGCISGPSYSFPHAGSSFTVQRDFVYGLKCRFWPSQAEEWVTRKRVHSWPGSELVSAIVDRGCNLVPVGSHTSSSREFEWRFSFSVAELMLVESLSKEHKLAYSILKALIKTEMKMRGIDVFASYHLKTALLWFLEKNGAESWHKNSLGANIVELLEFVTDFYTNGSVPNYFISKNNMIDHRSADEVQKTCSVLTDIRATLTLSLCRYVERNQALPVFFDKPLPETFNDRSNKFVQVCKYNLLLMALADILRHLKKSNNPLERSEAGYLVQKARLLHHISQSEGGARSSDSLPVSWNECTSGGSPDVATVLSVLEEFLAADQMKVTESSAVLLGVLNVVLTLHPGTLDEIGIEVNTPEFHNYLTIPAFKESLLWAARLHENHSDAIYEFVVAKWSHGPQFRTEDEEAKRVMKLLMVVLGKPTKQASAVTGSLAKRGVEGQRFILMRRLAEYLLHVHLESAYIAFQAAAFLMGTSVFSEIYNFVKWGYCKLSKLRAVELILSKTELQAQVSEEEFARLVQMQHELNG